MKFQNMITLELVEAQDWQMALKPGDCYVNELPIECLPKIYCQVLSEARDVGPGFFWVRAYSVLDPKGERGLNCIVDGTRPITRDEFDQAIKELQHG
jgi:hypothetical protein